MIFAFLFQATVAASAPAGDAMPSGPVLPDGFRGIWDVSEAACADPDSQYRLELSANEMKSGFADKSAPPAVLLEAFQPYYTEVSTRYLWQSGDFGGYEMYRFVLSDSGDQMFKEALPQIGESFNFYRRFYVRCKALEKADQ